MSQMSNRSSVRSDVPLICSQDLSDSSSESDIVDKVTKSVTISQSSDGFAAIKTIKLKIGSQDTSQSSIGRTGEKFQRISTRAPESGAVLRLRLESFRHGVGPFGAGKHRNEAILSVLCSEHSARSGRCE